MLPDQTGQGGKPSPEKQHSKFWDRCSLNFKLTERELSTHAAWKIEMWVVILSVNFSQHWQEFLVVKREVSKLQNWSGRISSACALSAASLRVSCDSVCRSAALHSLCRSHTCTWRLSWRCFSSRTASAPTEYARIQLGYRRADCLIKLLLGRC